MMKGEDPDMRVSQEAMLAINNAVEKFLEQFTQEAYAFCVRDRKKCLNYDHRGNDKLALNVTTEQGKTLKDAQGDVVEHACGMATLQMGEYVSNVSHGIDTYSIREPLGVCVGICPFNFPAMIP
ncbi:hypothetical protein JHK84_043459 [Glycine max]|nr:hypothetical protein JHK86_043277 [Glycine max]KAG4957533.1 hypothetical protein JHK85_043913 [Glycine max]KAG5117346.1 hypothetical protein JHK84_043459 [Glycine max]